MPIFRRTSERRNCRASHPADAATFYFEALVSRGGPEVVALSDGSALVAGTGGSDEELSDIAAFGAACLEDRATDDAPLAERDVFAHRVQCAGRELVLTTVGARVKGLRGLEQDLSRIFS